MPGRVGDPLDGLGKHRLDRRHDGQAHGPILHPVDAHRPRDRVSVPDRYADAVGGPRRERTVAFGAIERVRGSVGEDRHVARPTPAELAAARERTIADVLPGPHDPPLRVLFCGINPGLVSAATRHHFARPGNRFWPALHGAGFTPRLLRPAEQDELAGSGLGITNMVARATARADELSVDELRAGGRRRVGARTPR